MKIVRQILKIAAFLFISFHLIFLLRGLFFSLLLLFYTTFFFFTWTLVYIVTLFLMRKISSKAKLYFDKENDPDWVLASLFKYRVFVAVNCAFCLYLLLFASLDGHAFIHFHNMNDVMRLFNIVTYFR
jgi:hypothetical protein